MLIMWHGYGGPRWSSQHSGGWSERTICWRPIYARLVSIVKQNSKAWGHSLVACLAYSRPWGQTSLQKQNKFQAQLTITKNKIFNCLNTSSLHAFHAYYSSQRPKTRTSLITTAQHASMSGGVPELFWFYYTRQALWVVSQGSGIF